ncbi:MAG: hypothetical protein L6Q95_03955 [Planctomycetes bacterium]|nr:hypothetical protein [Planctomycetota bacterium]
MTGWGGGAGEGAGGPPAEAEFINEIDCQFPYFDRERALALASAACSISANAAFAVLFEVCNLPESAKAEADPEIRAAVLRRIETLLSHPLARVILPLAEGVLEGKPASVSERIDAMRRVAAFPGQYCALQVALYAADREEPWDDEADRVYDEIVASWERRGRER